MDWKLETNIYLNINILATEPVVSDFGNVTTELALSEIKDSL